MSSCSVVMALQDNPLLQSAPAYRRVKEVAFTQIMLTRLREIVGAASAPRLNEAR